jgi:hypothetical protein
MTRIRRQGDRRWAVGGALVALALSMLFGVAITSCGGSRYANVEFVRPASEERPIWVGVYFLNREGALDAEPISDLIANHDAYKSKPEVVDSYVFSLAPGKDRPVRLEPLDPAITWILLVAESDQTDPCTRKDIQVVPGKKVNLRVSVEGYCLQVTQAK